MFTYIYVCVLLVGSACKGQKRVPDTLELELQIVLVGNRN